jgi:hypothetical protein
VKKKYAIFGGCIKADGTDSRMGYDFEFPARNSVLKRALIRFAAGLPLADRTMPSKVCSG